MAIDRDTQCQTSEHEELIRLMPWYVNGSLSEAECRRVRDHLYSCVVCRGELNFQKDVARVVNREDVDQEAVSHHFSELRQQINQTGHGSTAHPAGSRGAFPVAGWFDHRRFSRVPVAAAAAAVMVVGLGVSLFLLPEGRVADPASGDYQTLSSPAAVPARVADELFIAFQQGTPDSSMAELLLQYGMEPVSRSADQRLWRVRLADTERSDGSLQAVITSLRSDDKVLFVDRVISGD